MPLGICMPCSRAFVLEDARESQEDCPRCGGSLRLHPVRRPEELPRVPLAILKRGTRAEHGR